MMCVKKLCLILSAVFLIVIPNSLQAQQDTVFVLDSTRILGPAFKNQRGMKIAFNGSMYFIFWGDTRERTLVNPANLYGARVRRNNFLLLDSLGLKLSETTGFFLACASDSNNFLVVNDSLEAQIFDSLGNQVCPPFQISTQNLNSTLLGATFGGNYYFVVWHDHTSPSYIRGARITQNGVVVDTNTIQISVGDGTPEGSLWFPAVCSGGGYYLVVWIRGSNYPKIYACRVSYEGTVIDTNGIFIADEHAPYNAEVAFGDSLWLIVYASSAPSGGIFAVRLDMDGNVLDTIPIVISNNNTGEWRPSVNYDGENFGVFYSDGGGYLFGKFVNKDGQIINSCQVSPLNYGFISTSIFDGTNYIIVYENTWDVYAAQVRPDGTVINRDMLITYSAYGQEWSRVVYGSANYLAVWQDQRNSAWYPNIYGARVMRDGTVLDPEGFGIAFGEDWLCSPDVCFNGTNYLVAWRKGRPGYEIYEQPDVWAGRVTNEGVVLDIIPIATSESFYEKDPAVASDGDKYLVTFSSNEGGYYYDIMGILVNGDGNIVPPGRFPISPYGDQYGQSSPCLYFGDSIYLCCWWDGRGATNWPNIYGARITRDGAVLDYGGFPIIQTQNTWRGVYGERLELGFDGSNFLLVWSEKRPSAPDWDIYGCRIGLDGQVLDPDGLPIYTETGNQRQPTVTYDGSNYLIFFTDGRWQDGNIFGVKMTPGGSIIDSFLINYPGAQHYPFVTTGPQNQVFLTYTGFLENNYKTMRIWGRLYPPLGIEETKISNYQPRSFNLLVYPNPAHKEICIEYTLLVKAAVELSIYDVSGRLVRTFVKEEQPPGDYRNLVDLTDYADGVYFIKLNNKDESLVQKVILIR